MPDPAPETRAHPVLVVEDDHALRSLLEDHLVEHGLVVTAVRTGEEALEVLGSRSAELVVSDLRLPGMDGFELLRRTRELEDPPAFLVITAFGTIGQAVEALKAGADDFLTKPLELEHLTVRVARILETRRLRSQVRRYREALGNDEFHGLIGRSPPMLALFRELKRIGRGMGPVLLQGESGVGKELAARAIHQESRRSDGPFLAVNCAGVPENLLESEFFGHVEGAFSGATTDRPGLFQEASGGTLLLDEIGEMPAALQATLLRVLQGGTIRPVGSDRTLEVDVRVVAATNRDLQEALAEGQFREDLFYRLETFRVHLPPLRDREGDVDLLTRHFVGRHAARLEREPPRPSAPFLDALRSYPFPGNVRELENVVERAVTFCEGGVLEPRHLPARIREWDGEAGDLGRRTDSKAPAPAREGSDGPLPALLAGGSIPTLREVEGAWVRHVLDHTGGNKRRAAALLGVSRRTLYRKLDGSESGG